MRAAILTVALLFVLPASSPAATLRFFHSPSRNIDCLVTSDYARCDIQRFTFTPPRKPAGCGEDWGFSLSVKRTSRRGAFACVGDTIREPSAPTLAYGRSVSVGGMRCTSRTDGVRCVNRRRHGFLVARARFRLF